MAERYVLSNPVEVGDLDNRITVDELVVTGFGFNLQPHYTAQGKAGLSVTLTHLPSGVSKTVTYEDDTALAMAHALNTADLSTKSLLTRLLEKLQTDGKLPAGSVVTT